MSYINVLSSLFSCEDDQFFIWRINKNILLYYMLFISGRQHHIWVKTYKIVNNFLTVNFAQLLQCLIISWYISCDIQFCILGVIIVYIYTKNIKLGIGLLIAMLGASIAVPFIITIMTKREGIIKILIPWVEFIIINTK